MPDFLKPIATQPDGKGDFTLKVPVSYKGISLKPGKYNFYQLYDKYRDKLPPVIQPRKAEQPIMAKRIAKSASEVGAKEPKTGSLEVGSYKAGKTNADGFGRKAIGHVTPKKTETFDTVPDKGYKSVSVSNLEVGGYKRK